MQWISGAWETAKQTLAPMFNQILVYISLLGVVFLYLKRRDKNTRDNAINEAKVESYEVQRENFEKDKKNADFIDNNLGNSEHSVVVEWLRKDGQLRDGRDAK